MTITPQQVLAALRSALARTVEVDPDVPLIESDLRVNSLAMFAVLAQLEGSARVQIPEHDLIRLSVASVNEIVAWFAQHAAPASTPEPAAEPAPRYHHALRADELAEGDTRAVTIEQQALVIARHDGQFYAAENRCPHQGLELVGARLRRGQLICRHHGARFDLTTGESKGPQTSCPLVLYPVRVVEDRVEVALPHPTAPL